MRLLIKQKLRLIGSVLVVFMSAVGVFSGSAAAAATCYTYDTTTYTKVACSQLQNDQPGFQPNNSGTHCYGERADPHGIEISEIDCLAASTNGKDLSNTSVGGDLPQLCGFSSSAQGDSCKPAGNGTSSCGTDPATGDPVKTSVNFGCKGSGNPIMRLLFAIVRFIAAGVGVVLVASVVVAGIQFSSSRGDPNVSAGAIKRLQSTVAALFLYVFAYALLNYLVPGGFLHP